MEASVGKACREYVLPPEEYAKRIEDLVMDTNGIFTSGGGLDRACLAEYCRSVARGIRRCLDEGLGDPTVMNFGELYNYGVHNDEVACKFTEMRMG